MNYLKTIFPVCNTLQNHLRQHTGVTESEIIECTKSFPYTIVVCDKILPSAPFNGPCGPCQYKFAELFSFGERKRANQEQLFVEDSLNISPWFRFHAVVGDALTRYFLEKAHLFRSLDNSECPNFVLQISGTPVFGSGAKMGTKAKKKEERKLKKVEKAAKKKELAEKVAETNNGGGQIETIELDGTDQADQDIIVVEENLKKKKKRRQKKRKLQLLTSNFPSTVPQSRQVSTTHYELAASAQRIPAKRFLHCFNLRERFNMINHPVAIAAKSKTNLDRSFLEKTFGFLHNDPIFMDARSSVNILISLLSRWIKLHRRHVVYSSYLNMFCPIDESVLKTATDGKTAIQDLVRQYCPKFRVKRALEAIFFHVIPLELFGEDNTARLLNAIIQFVVTCGRYDVVSLHRVAECIKTNKCLWLRNISDSSLRHHLMLRVLNLVIRYLLRVVSSCFYVTESQSEKYQLFFYRKPLWLRICRMAGAQFLESCKLKRIKDIDDSPCYGPFALRWIPKSGGNVRPIICGQFGLKREPGSNLAPGGSVVAMNQDLRPVLAVAQYLVRRNPGILGHSTSDFRDIHIRWKDFVHRTYKNNDSSIPNCYIVTADITGCFDAIDQHVLWNLVQEHLLANAPGHFSLQGHYVLRSSASTDSGSVASSFTSRKYRYAVRPLNKYESLARHYSALQENSTKTGTKRMSSSKYGTLVVPKGEPMEVSKEELTERFHRLIFRRILTVNGDRHKYFQTLGISQGSSLSVLLCNLYLAALERKYLDPLISTEDDLLMRHVDDYLFVTPSLERAQKFAETISRGFSDFNCFFKLEKTVTNIEWQIPISDEISIIMSSNDRPNKNIIPWCGLLFHADTLGVSVDPDRWQSKDPRHMIVVDYSKYPPSYVIQKIFYYLRARISTIVFDKSINNLGILSWNIKCIMEILVRWYDGYLRAYDNSRLIDQRAKIRLRDRKFLEELARRVQKILNRKVQGLQGDLVKMKMVRRAFLGFAKDGMD